jgi:hypothetical protein
MWTSGSDVPFNNRGRSGSSLASTPVALVAEAPSFDLFVAESVRDVVVD